MSIVLGFVTLDDAFQGTLTKRQLDVLSISDKVNYAVCISEKADRWHSVFETYEEYDIRKKINVFNQTIQNMIALGEYINDNRATIIYMPEMLSNGSIGRIYNNTINVLLSFDCVFDKSVNIDDEDGDTAYFVSRIPSLTWLKFNERVANLERDATTINKNAGIKYDWYQKFDVPQNWQDLFRLAS